MFVSYLITYEWTSCDDDICMQHFAFIFQTSTFCVSELQCQLVGKIPDFLEIFFKKFLGNVFWLGNALLIMEM
jgi:hypothetical protein